MHLATGFSTSFFPPPQFISNAVDICDFQAICKVFTATRQVGLVVHTSAQPPHDWAFREPFTDFGVNSQGTLNMREAVRKFASHYPGWHLTKTVRDILAEIHEYNLSKWKAEGNT